MADCARNAGLGGNGGSECGQGDVFVKRVERVKCSLCVWKFCSPGGVTGGIRVSGAMGEFERNPQHLYVRGMSIKVGFCLSRECEGF